MMEKFLLYILWFSVWILLAWPPNFKYAFMGAIASLFVTLMTLDTFRASGVKDDLKWPGIVVFTKKVFWFICYLGVFLWECLKANIDVAWRVLSPRVPIRPGTIRMKTMLKSDVGLTFLANSIILTPGTTTIDIDKTNGYIYIHVLYVKAGTDLSRGAVIELPVVSKFERILKRIFE